MPGIRPPRPMNAQGEFRCGKCDAWQPPEAFHTDRSKTSGRSNICKQCHKDRRRDGTPETQTRAKERRRQWRRDNPKLAKAQRRQHYLKNRERVIAQTNEYKKRNKERHAAHTLVRLALAQGRLERGTECARCGDDYGPIQAHHHDYTKPLEVEWLCVSCHRNHHSS